MTGCEGVLTFRELTLSPSSGRAGGLVAPKLITRLFIIYQHLHKLVL